MYTETLLKNPDCYKSTLIIFNNILYCVWEEHSKLMYCSFNGSKWSNSYKIDTDSFDNIDMYNYIYENNLGYYKQSIYIYIYIYDYIFIYEYKK